MSIRRRLPIRPSRRRCAPGWSVRHRRRVLHRRDGLPASRSRGYPLRLGHEWCGEVAAIGDGVPVEWLGRRVTGDTMLGCGHCYRCLERSTTRVRRSTRDRHPRRLAGRARRATARSRVGAAPATRHRSMTWPGPWSNPREVRCVRLWRSALAPGRRVLIWGLGPIGLLATQFALAANAEVHVVGLTDDARALATTLGADGAWAPGELPALPWDAIIDATNDVDVPRQALDLVEPGGRVVYIGLSGEPSTIDTRELVLRDITAVGVLSGSPVVAAVIEEFASGRVDPRPLWARRSGSTASPTSWPGGGPTPPASGRRSRSIPARRRDTGRAAERFWRWRWDLNPRRAFTLTRFRGVRARPLRDSTAGEPS